MQLKRLVSNAIPARHLQRIINMPDNVIMQDDFVVFDVNSFTGICLLGSIPLVSIKGKGLPQTNNKICCIKGDETSVKVSVQYLKTGHNTSGMGELTIKALKSQQQSKITKMNNNAFFILQGKLFDAVFTVIQPSQNIIPPATFEVDGVHNKYTGTGEFKLQGQFRIQFT